MRKSERLSKSQGVEDVSQLSGGIHKYLEAFPTGGYFKGANYVFDKRFLQRGAAASGDIVGECVECGDKHEQFDGLTVCAVCRDIILVCATQSKAE